MKKLAIAIVMVSLLGCKVKECVNPNGTTNCNCVHEEIGTWQKDGKPFTGYCETYQGDTLVSSSTMENGLIHGELIEYYPNGNKRISTEYKNGMVDGTISFYRKDGTPDQSGYVVGNKKQGDWFMYYENGKIKSHDHYKDNILNDTSKMFYRNGNLRAVGYYNMGSEGSSWMFYDSITGKFDGYGLFENGQMVGIAPVYDGTWPIYVNEKNDTLAINMDTAVFYSGFTTLVQFVSLDKVIPTDGQTVKVDAGEFAVIPISEGQFLYQIEVLPTDRKHLNLKVSLTGTNQPDKALAEFNVPIVENDD